MPWKAVIANGELTTANQLEKKQGKWYSALCRLVKSVVMSVTDECGGAECTKAG